MIGRPNVGKSTLINRLLGSNRLITSPEPGTTRDSVLVPCERDGRKFVLIDTAGIRRRARVSEMIEKFSIVQSLQAIEDAGAVIALLDARDGVSDQDLHLDRPRGRARPRARDRRQQVGRAHERRAPRDGARRGSRGSTSCRTRRVHYASALHGSGIAEIVDAALVAYQDAPAPSSRRRGLNQVLEDALDANPPPLVRGRHARLRYAHQGGRYPPVVVVHGSQAERLPDHYKRYLENTFRVVLKLKGTPVRVELRSGANPLRGQAQRAHAAPGEDEASGRCGIARSRKAGADPSAATA